MISTYKKIKENQTTFISPLLADSLPMSVWIISQQEGEWGIQYAQWDKLPLMWKVHTDTSMLMWSCCQINSVVELMAKC